MWVKETAPAPVETTAPTCVPRLQRLSWVRLQRFSLVASRSSVSSPGALEDTADLSST